VAPHAHRVRAAVDGHWEHESIIRRLRAEWPLLLAWTRKEYRTRYRQSVLGLAWSVLQPLATLAAFGAVLSGVLKVSSEHLPYVSFAFAGLVPWSFVASTLMLATGSLLNASSVIGKAYFPREVVPLATMLTFAIDLTIATGLLLVIIGIQGVGYSVTMVGLAPIYAVLLLYGAAIATFTATLTVFVRDLRFAVPLVVQLLFIVSPVMYSPKLLPHAVRWANEVNPIAVIVTATRAVGLHHHWPAWGLLGIHALVAGALTLLAVAYVRSVEPRIADVV
jgi:ABC-type polysaccharide/polyol phosphate export permease